MQKAALLPPRSAMSRKAPPERGPARPPSTAPGPLAGLLGVQRRYGNNTATWLVGLLRRWDFRRTEGRPLPIPLRRFMEVMLGVDFGAVRVHTGPAAERVASGLGAAAFALGPDIYFGRRGWDPDGDGLPLLAHELIHVAQWRNAGSQQPALDPAAAAGGQRPVQAEAEAEWAVTALQNGQPARVTGTWQGAMPLSHPVYISRHGTQGYLRLARQFYERWGYAPITANVNSLEDIITDLARQPAIGRVTIVSHAHPTQIFLRMFAGGRVGIAKEDWAVDTPEELMGTEMHYVSEEVLNDTVRLLRADRAANRLLARLGGAANSLLRQYIWWALEHDFVSRAGYPRRRRIQLQRMILSVMNSYRDTLIQSVAGRQPQGAAPGGGGQAGRAVPAPADFDALRQSIETIARGWDWRPEGRRERRAFAGQLPRAARQLQRSPSRLINRVIRSDFFRNLARVRDLIRRDSWIEIQGCRAGQDRDYVVQMQRFFSSSRTRPRASAPSWFQAFGSYGFTPVPDSPRALRRLWRQRRVREALAYWQPILLGRPLPADADAGALGAFLRTPHALPLAIPADPALPTVLFLQGRGEDEFLAWLSRHGYRLQNAIDIHEALFTQERRGRRRDLPLAAGIRRSLIDWLQEERVAHGRLRPSHMVFRPDPEYRRHIEDIPGGAVR
jgi:hypothetical protein